MFYSEGKDVTLKDTDTDVESYEPRQPRPKFKRFPRFRSNTGRRRTVSEGGGAEARAVVENGGGAAAASGGNESQTDTNGDRHSRRYTRTRRFFRSRRTPQSETRGKENGNTVSVFWKIIKILCF